MTLNRDDDLTPRAYEVLAKILQNNELDELRLAFLRGEISAERLINEITARYQRGIGSAVQALAEHDKDLAQQVGERIRSRLDEQLQSLAARDARVSKKKEPKSPSSEGLKDRTDDVLQREYLILNAVAGSDIPVKAADIFKLVRAFDPGLSDNVITAHLARMHEMGVIGKAGKGKYHKVAPGAAHSLALADAIEARGLPLPKITE
jgi:hypothetical protein